MPLSITDARAQMRGRAGNPAQPNGPPVVAAGHSGNPSDDAQANVHIAAGRVGVGTYLMGLLHQSLGVRARQSWKRDGEFDVEAKAAGRTGTDADGRDQPGDQTHTPRLV